MDGKIVAFPHHLELIFRSGCDASIFQTETAKLKAPLRVWADKPVPEIELEAL